MFLLYKPLGLCSKVKIINAFSSVRNFVHSEKKVSKIWKNDRFIEYDQKAEKSVRKWEKMKRNWKIIQKFEKIRQKAVKKCEKTVKMDKTGSKHSKKGGKYEKFDQKWEKVLENDQQSQKSGKIRKYFWKKSKIF